MKVGAIFVLLHIVKSTVSNSCRIQHLGIIKSNSVHMSFYKLSILSSLFSLSVAIDDIKVVSVVLKETNLNEVSFENLLVAENMNSSNSLCYI